MSKAEERAWDAYPRLIESSCGFRDDIYEYHRKAYIEGYHQAEKDNELSWEDIKCIYLLVISVSDMQGWEGTDKSMYQEVLKRFKDFKEREEK